MTTRDFCQSGAAEPLKAGVHGLLGLIAAACCLYNLAAYLTRVEKEPRLLVNAAIYGSLAGLEAYQTSRHLEHTDGE